MISLAGKSLFYLAAAGDMSSVLGYCFRCEILSKTKYL